MLLTSISFMFMFLCVLLLAAGLLRKQGQLDDMERRAESERARASRADCLLVLVDEHVDFIIPDGDGPANDTIAAFHGYLDENITTEDRKTYRVVGLPWFRDYLDA